MKLRVILNSTVNSRPRKEKEIKDMEKAEGTVLCECSLVEPCWGKIGQLGLRAMIPVQTELLMAEVTEHESSQLKYSES